MLDEYSVGWAVVLVIVVLVGLISAFMNPVITLTKSIVSLKVVLETVTTELKDLKNSFNAFIEDNLRAHQRIWDKNEAQDSLLSEHSIILSKHTEALVHINEILDRCERQMRNIRHDEVEVFNDDKFEA